MARVVEDALVIKFSKLVKDIEGDDTEILTADMIQALEQVAQELAGSGIVVETLSK